MPPYETLDKARLQALMQYLVRNRTLIKYSIPNTPFESLTILSDLQPRQNPEVFRIDLVPEFIDDKKIVMVDFDFNGPDRLQYRFHATIKQMTVDTVWLKIPDEIERYQQRDHVRIIPGLKSVIKLPIEMNEIDLPISDVSLGGALCVCPNSFRRFIDINKTWENVPVILTLGFDFFHLSIGKMEVVRKSTGTFPGHFNLAVAFRRIDRPNQKKLAKFINSSQRVSLSGKHY